MNDDNTPKSSNATLIIVVAIVVLLIPLVFAGIGALYWFLAAS